MSPMVSGTKNNEEYINISKTLKYKKQKLSQFRKYIENNFEYIGKDFSKKVREIYYDKKKQQSDLRNNYFRGKRRIGRGRNRFIINSLGE